MTIELTLLSRVAYRGREVTGPRVRGLLALLADEPRSGCSSARLVEGLWPDEQPERPIKALQVVVSRARSQLGAELIASTPTGYRLSLAPEQVDVTVVGMQAERAARHAAAGEHDAALAAAEDGLAAWDGVPESTSPGGDDPVAILRADQAATYRALDRLRALSLARLDRPAEAVEPLAALVAERPLDEEALAELLRSEAATAGPAAALTRYDAYRRRLRDELGADPGAALREIHEELLHASEPAVRIGVPEEPNPLLGRADDLEAVARALRTSRVVSIVGPGGLGKTRLAQAVSRRAEQSRVQLIMLASFAAGADVASGIAAVLETEEVRRPTFGPPQPSTDDAIARIRAALGSGPSLLVLDNCEHLLDELGVVVGELIARSPRLRVLTTSRAPLGLSSESVYPLAELDLATAAELFGERARAARPGVELDADQVRELCAHLDGLPLAVELAAARVRILSVPEITHRLEDRFALLRGGSRDTPERHHTLYAVVDWSWSLLEPADRQAMRALSVFPDGFGVDGAVTLLAESGYDESGVLRLLERLTDQSLLRAADTAAGVRFRMLETVREFAADRRAEAGEDEQVLESFLAWARRCGTAYDDITGPDVASCIERLRAEQENLALALARGLERSDGAVVAATTALLGGLWFAEGSYNRVAGLSRQTAWLLSHHRPARDEVEVTRGAAVLCATVAVMLEGSGSRWLVTLRRLPPAPPDTVVRSAAVALGQLDAIVESGGRRLVELYASGNSLLVGMAGAIGSYVFEQRGELDDAMTAAGRMLEAFSGKSTPWLEVLAHSRLGELAIQLELDDELLRHWNAALGPAEEMGLWQTLAGMQWALALGHLRRGEVERAETWMARQSTVPPDESPGADRFEFGARGDIALVRGQVDEGLRLWRRAAASPEPCEESTYRPDPFGADLFVIELRSAAVVAHVHHARVELVADLIDPLRADLEWLLTHPIPKPPVFLLQLPTCGCALLALGMTELDAGWRTESGARRAWGARAVALAERFRYLRGFQPTMSSARAREAARAGHAAAYAAAAETYSDLPFEALRPAALELLNELP